MSKSNFIEIITATFAAGESRLFALSGQYFELIDATFSVDVALSDVYGAQRGLMRNAEASFNLKNTDFAVIQITSASAQTVRFAYGSGEAGTRRASGAVSIVGAIALDVQTSDKLNRPELPIGNWNSNTAMVANTPVTIFTPGSNTNGAIVWVAESSDSTNASYVQSFIAKSTAPANPFDGQIIAMSNIDFVSTTPTVFASAKMVNPQRLEAGVGLYFISSAAGTATHYGRHARFTLL